MREQMRQTVEAAQDTICEALEALDDARFEEDRWEREGGGGGRSRVLQGGSIFEKAGVNSSVVYGTLSEEAAAAMRARRGKELGTSREFFATGVSLVFHPRNPWVPTVHANFRYFELGEGDAWWFGGGADLTPNFLDEEDAVHFHTTFKTTCDRHDPSYYPKYKAWCDRYFRIPHRGESRGVGGIFFDDLEGDDPAVLHAFVADCAASFLPAYMPLVMRHKDRPFSEAQRKWQLLRRGRYAEFNLVYDRGTLFGLRTAARIESVLMSLPPLARWDYVPSEEREPEAQRLLAVLREPRDWV